MGFKVTRVSLSNFKGFPSDPIISAKFDNQLNILSGPNGFGKTTIFDALELIFSHDMTRFKGIENGNQKFENHLFLNDPSKNGFLCIDLSDGNTLKQYGAIINNDQNWKFKNIIKESFSFFELDQSNIISNWGEIASEDAITYIKEKSVKVDTPLVGNFNVCYYVSQEESTHLLKKSIKDREDSLAPLIGQDYFNSKYEKFKKSIDLFGYDDTELQRSINELKVLSYNESINVIPYEKIYPEKELDWDKQYIESPTMISSYVNLLEKLKLGRLFIEEVSQYLLNSKIDKLIRDDETNQLIKIMQKQNILTIEDLRTVVLSEKNIYDKVAELKRFYEQLVNSTSQPFFRIDEVKKAITRINVLISRISADELGIIDDPRGSSESLAEFAKLLERRIGLLELQDKLTTEKKNLEQIRSNINQNLEEYTRLLNQKEVHCPVCYSEFTSLDKLQGDINHVDSILELITSNEVTQLKDNWNDIEIVSNKIKDIFSQLERKGKLIDWESVDIKTFIDDQTKVKTLRELLMYIQEEHIEIDYESKWIEKLITKKRDLNDEFIEALDGEPVNEFVKSLNNFLGTNSKESFINAVLLMNEKLIDMKISYLHYLKKSSENEKYQQLISRVKVMVKEKLQWGKMDIAYSEVNEILKTSEKRLKKTIVEAIRIPLLVYTAKMLQNYQGGLGVYIDDSSLRFVSAAKQPDILNKFSSGQLSAFVLTFLLLMNKLYVDENKEYQFLLIDDPVQTMDEINLSSFVDVLRREFVDKQIILSTHEEDKKNYIGYKFIKNGSTVKVINVKDQWYSV